MTELEDPRPGPGRVRYVVFMVACVLGSLTSMTFYIWTQDGRWGWTAFLFGVVVWFLATTEDDE